MLKNICLSLTIVALLSGCAVVRKPMPISLNATGNPSKVIIKQLTGLENPSYIMAGQQGLLDNLFTSSMGSSVEDALKKLNVTSIVDKSFFSAFKKALEQKGFKVIVDSKPLDRSTLLAPPIDDETHAPFDFSALKDTRGAGYALILQPNSFGIYREYYSIIPTGDPVGLTNLSIYLVKLDDNTLHGYYTTVVSSRALSNWDSGSEYESLMSACKKSLETALNDGYEYFFEENIWDDWLPESQSKSDA